MQRNLEWAAPNFEHSKFGSAFVPAPASFEALCIGLPDLLKIDRIVGFEEDVRAVDRVADSTVPRYRPIVIVPDGATDKTRAATRAANYRDQAAGEGIRARITTAGWRDSTGALWLPGNKVWTESDFLGLAQDMLIETVEYEKDDVGSLAYLDLVDPRAHGGKSGKGGQSNAQWNMDSSAAQDN